MVSAGTPRTRLSPEDRRRQILEVARRQFASRPRREVTTASVAREAGVTRGLVHHYFGGVRDLYVEVLGQVSVDAVAIPGRIEGLTREQRVARNVDAWLDWTEQNRETFLALARHGDSSPGPEVGRLVEAGRAAATDRIIAANSDLISDTPGARLAVRGLMAMHQAACASWFAGETSRGQVHTLLTSVFLDLLSRTIPSLDSPDPPELQVRSEMAT
jgi:AcrR family transcriptional regulator